MRPFVNRHPIARTGIRLAALSAVLVAVSFAAGCGKPDPADRPLVPSEIRDPKTLFSRNCTGCHGAEGKLGPAPPLNDPLFLAIMPQKALSDLIHNGRSGTLMPGFGQSQVNHLDDDQIRLIVEFVYGSWASKEKPPADLPPYAIADGGQGNAQAGKTVFAQACARCHGKDGKGGTPGGTINDRAFLSLVSDQMLRRTVITGRSDLGMPDFRRQKPDGALSNQDIADVVALMSEWRKQAMSETVGTETDPAIEGLAHRKPSAQ